MLRGTVVAISPDTLSLRLHSSTGALAVAASGIHRLEVSRGVRSRTEGAVRGAVFLGMVGGLEWAIIDSDQSDGLLSKDREAFVAGAAVGVVLGAVFGAIAPLERWKRVRLR